MLQRIGRYEILERIGRGGQGTVYRARDTTLDRVVAVKVIDQPVTDDPAYLEALRREARLAAGLTHPNIVTVHDFQIEDDIAYIVMEFLPDSLDKNIHPGQPIPYQRAVEIAIQVSRGLAYAHTQGVVHRDIKPGNILLTSEGDAQVTDFGIARAIVSSSRASQTGAAGTYHYMPHEQWTEPTIDQRADIYALGVTLFQMLTGDVPFDGVGPGEIFLKHRDERVPRFPSQLGVPREIEDVVRRALEKNPERRFASADAMAGALERALTGAVSRGQQPAHPPEVSASVRGGRAVGTPWRFLFGGAAVLIAVIAIGIAVVYRGNDGGAQVAVPVPETKPPTSAPPTAVPPTAAPPTAVLPTAVPPTAAPPTAVPPTAVPPTAAPPTAVPPTAAPPTAVPPTAAPPTAVPPTAAPPTAAPPTAVPPTAAPPTAAPPTAVPPTGIPPRFPSGQYTTTVASISGTGSVDFTRRFSSETSPWVIEGGAESIHRVRIMDANTGKVLEWFPDLIGPTLVYGLTGTFYLNVLDSGSWTVKIKPFNQ